MRGRNIKLSESYTCIFPQPKSGLSSGILTPTMDDFRSMSPDQGAPGMNDLLSALRNISTSEEPVQEQAQQVSWLWLLLT